MLYLIPLLIPIAFFAAFGAIIKTTNYSSGANFTQCNTFIQNITDPILYNVLFPNTFWSKNVTSKYLSLPGCYAHCGGTGFEFWPAKDTIDRVSLWVIPALILLTHFSFAPVDIWNTPSVIIHAVGDPIDSILGLLSRIEVNRRILHRSKELCRLFRNGPQDSKEDKPKGLLESLKSSQRYFIFDCIAQPISQALFPDPWEQEPTTEAEHIAAVAAAYEECGWQDVLKHLQETLGARSGDKTSNRTKPSRQDLQNRSHLDSTSKTCELRDDEMECIKRASHELAKCRQHSQVNAIIPIVSLAISLATAINRTVHQIEQTKTRLIKETAHSIAVLSLFFIFLPIVVFSARLGTFTTILSPVEIIKEMRDKLNSDEKMETELFPPLQYSHPSLLDYERGENRHDKVDVVNWSQRASFSGINPTYRPCKHLLPRDFSKYTQEGPSPSTKIVVKIRRRLARTLQALKVLNCPDMDALEPWWKHLWANITNQNRSRRLLRYYSVLFVVGGACVPAIFLSATNHGDERKVAVGCRSLSWLTITALWLFSSALDLVRLPEYLYALRAARTRWRYTIYKDICIVIPMVVLVRVPESSYALRAAQTRWRYTIYKDICIVIPMIVLVTWIQIGYFNSCWCRASFSGYINLNPYSDKEWYQARVLWGTIGPTFFVFNLGLIAWILLVGGKSEGLLCRSQIQLQRDAMDLSGMQRDDGEANE